MPNFTAILKPIPNPLPNLNPNLTISLPNAKHDARAKNYLAVVLLFDKQ